MPDLLELTSPAAKVWWPAETVTEHSLWHHFSSWGWWSIMHAEECAHSFIELTQAFIEQGADNDIDFVSTFLSLG